MSAPFPLPDHFFPPLRVPRERLDELRTESEAVVQQALLQCSTFRGARASDEVPFDQDQRFVAEHGVLTEFNEPFNAEPTRNISQSFGIVQAKYRELVQYFKCETREEYYNSQKMLFDFTADVCVLHTVPPQDRRSPHGHEAIKWTAYELFPLNGRADSCHYEATGKGVDAQGEPYTYQVVVPAIFAEVPDLFEAKQSVRIFTAGVIIMRPCRSREGVSDVYVTTHNDFRSRHVHRSMHSRFQLSLGAVSELLGARRKDAQFVFDRNAWVPKTCPGKCYICSCLFSILRTSHSCVVCDHAVCLKCTQKATAVRRSTAFI